MNATETVQPPARPAMSRQVGTALVTGASSGIGLELASLLGADGYDLCLVARDERRLNSLADTLARAHGARPAVLATDLADPGAPERIFQAFPRADLLVNNAAFGLYGPFLANPLAGEIDMIHVNIMALTHLVKLYLPGMVKSGRGRILNVASMGSLIPGPYFAVYYATKAYVLSFSEALSAELEGTGVTVTTLCPGATRTRFEATSGADKSGLYRGRTMEAKDVAREAHRALLRGKRTVFAGFINRVMAASSRLTPRCVLLRMAKNWNQPLGRV